MASQAQEALQEEKAAHGVVRRTLLSKDVEIGQLKGEVGWVDSCVGRCW
jgi:hypothetical protein